MVGGIGVTGSQKGRDCLPPHALMILSSGKRVLKQQDQWILRSETKRSLAIAHRHLGVTFCVPRTSVLPVLRRVAGVRSMEVSGGLDYVISDMFAEVGRFLQLADIKTKDRKEAFER